jgi:glycosyltransferase involved in cell wall biosynthesis
MKVLMLAPGVSPHSKRPLNWLLNNGLEVSFADAVDPQPNCDQGYHYVGYPFFRGISYYQKALGSTLANQLALWASVPRLKKLYQKCKPDIVHVHWVDSRAYFCVKAGIKPLVLTVWGSDINQHFQPNADPISRQIVGTALAGADKIIVDSPDMPEKCELLAGCKLSTDILPIGIDTQLFRPGYEQAALEWKKKLEIPDNANVFLSARALTSHYRHHLILEAFSEIVPQLKKNVVLVFKTFSLQNTSDCNSYELQLRARAEKLGISENIRWISEIPYTKLPEVYAFSDAIINYPLMDAFPVTFLEAAACERPVITCRLPSYLGTFVEKYFYLIDSESIKELANAMLLFANTNHLQQKQLATESRQLIQHQYNESVIARKLINIYSELA